MPSCRVSDIQADCLRKCVFPNVSTTKFCIADFDVCIRSEVIIFLCPKTVPKAGLNTPPAGVYSNQEYLKYSGFEYPPVGHKHLFCLFSSGGAQLKPGIFQMFLI